MTDPMEIPPMALRVALVAGGLDLWFLTQSLLRYRPSRQVLGRPHGRGWIGIRLSPYSGRSRKMSVK
jgi:hypothetical protein